MAYIIVHQRDPFPLLGAWIIVIIIVAVIGLLNQSSPERPYQTFKEDNSKIQYITIGGSTTTKVSTS
uniref:p7b n=1 Tax=Tobacco necrosis virus (strain D) TaxID=12056 RepID=C7AXL9_TNVD|nr:p7b [Tobacco necrosis virus D]